MNTYNVWQFAIWPNFLVWSQPWYCIVSPLLKTVCQRLVVILSKVFQKLKLRNNILTKNVLINIILECKKNQKDSDGSWHKNLLWKSDFGTLSTAYVCWFLAKMFFRTHHWRKSTTELTLSTFSILIITYTFIHICVLSKNVKLDWFFFSGKITFVSTTPPCGHGDESRHCRQASGQTVPQNLHTETWKCQVKYCIATHKLQQMINWLGMKNVRFTHYYYGLRCIHGLRTPNETFSQRYPKLLGN